MEGIKQLSNLCGIDVGCTNVKMAAVVNGELSTRRVRSGDDLSRDTLIKEISSFYKSFDCDFLGLGIAFSGCTTDGHTVCHTSLPCLENLSADDFYHLNSNVHLINDSNATALAGTLEFPNSKVLLGITNGSGIGCGIVINGALFTGSAGLAGEIYGNPVIDDALTSIKVGKICSGSKILKRIHPVSDAEKNISVIDSASQYMGATLVSLIHSFNPDVIYCSGGGFDFAGYFSLTKDFVSKHAYPHFLKNLTIVLSSFDPYSGCIGAMKSLLNLN